MTTFFGEAIIDMVRRALREERSHPIYEQLRDLVNKPVHELDFQSKDLDVWDFDDGGNLLRAPSYRGETHRPNNPGSENSEEVKYEDIGDVTTLFGTRVSVRDALG
jgi:hypothetical protein